MLRQAELLGAEQNDPFSREVPFDPVVREAHNSAVNQSVAERDPLDSFQQDACVEGGGDYIDAQQPSLLCQEALEILAEFSDKQIFRAAGVTGFPSPGALDLYSGRCGIARELVKVGCPWVICFDWTRSADDNLLNKSLQAKIFRLIELGAFYLVGSALICSSMSKAVTPAVRSPRYPRGLPVFEPQCGKKFGKAISNADFTKEAITRAESAGAHFWVENPDSSYLWRMRGYQRFLDPSSDWTMRIDFCRFKTKWRKRTRFGTSIPSLRGLRMLCLGGHEHLILRGMSRIHRRPCTSVAEPYPKGLCKLVAGAASKACGLVAGEAEDCCLRKSRELEDW